MKRWYFLIIGVALGIILTLAWGMIWNRTLKAPTVSNSNSNTNTTTNTDATVDNANTDAASFDAEDTISFSTTDLPERDERFHFDATLPAAWAAEYLADSTAINFYDPTLEGDDSLNQSKIFVQYFTGTAFTAPASATATTIDKRPAKSYAAALGAGTSKPTWAAQTTTMVQVKVDDAATGLYYTVTKAPSVSAATFDAFLKSLVLSPVEPE